MEGEIHTSGIFSYPGGGFMKTGEINSNHRIQRKQIKNNCFITSVLVLSQPIVKNCFSVDCFYAGMSVQKITNLIKARQIWTSLLALYIELC